MDNTITLIDETGQEHDLQILFTFDNEETGRKFVLVTSFDEDDDEVLAFSYDEEGNLDLVEDEEELEACAEMLQLYNEGFNGQE